MSKFIIWTWLVLLVTLPQQTSTSLSSFGAHVCSYTETYSTTITVSRSTSSGWWLGKSKKTVYSLETVSRLRTKYRCCHGWTQSYSSSTECSLAMCYWKTSHTGACSKRGNCVSPENCQCHVGYTGSECESCYGAGGNPENSLYWRSNSHPDCALTCSWRNQWCWPGDCPDERLRTSCKCRVGFRKLDGGSSYTKCDLTRKPELLTCNIKMTDSHGSTRMSTKGATSTACEFESDTYVSLKPKSLNVFLKSSVTSLDLSNPPNFIQKQGVGIVRASTSILKQDISGRATTLTHASLHGGPSCNQAMSDTSPSSSLTCSNTFPVTTDVADGERLCVLYTSTSGGYFKYTDFKNNLQGIQTFSHNDATKQLCFRFDFTKPAHCSKINRCTSEPLVLSSRITRNANIHIRSSGWSDPVPHGGSSQAASGLAHSKLYIYETVAMGSKLAIDYKNERQKIQYNDSFSIDTSIRLPDKSGLYVVLFEIEDKAGNRQTVRRFVLYDKTSVIKSDPNKPLQISTATTDTRYLWQTNHGKVCALWTDRYYNNHFSVNNPLKPVMSQPEVESSYDQTSGPLPISGTTNVHGITEALYSFSIDKSSNSLWMHVPSFTGQSLCLSPKLHDGQVFTINLRMKDIMQNTFDESLSVNIDSTVPDITHMWLVKNGTKQVYVHDSNDLSKMVLQFDVKDLHSGIKLVEWFIGTKDHSQDLGHGNVMIHRLNESSCQPHTPCYCPSIGQCQFSNYTVALNKLVASGTNVGQHNQPIYFTVVATNEAGLKDIDHLDILVDTSPPEVGTVKEGSLDGPDVDYTSEDTVLVNWAGFIDHESGINHYLVAISRSCLSLAEIENVAVSKAVIFPYDTSQTKFRISAPGKYITTVVAYNEALSPSKVACSDGILKDDSPPSIYNVSLSGATISEHVVCYDNSAWLVRQNLTMIRMKASDECQKICAKSASVALANVLPKENVRQNDTDLSDSRCRHLPHLDAGSIIYLPSDKIHLSWNATERDSQISSFSVGFGTDVSSEQDPDLLSYKSTKGHHFFKLNHAGLAGKSVFFIFIKAVNKAGLIAHTSMGPVMIDNTPPLIKEKLTPKIVGQFVYVHWKTTTFEDPEEQSNAFTVLYSIKHDDKHVTPILQTPKSTSKQCMSQGHAGCIRYPLKQLQHMDSALNKPFIFELYVYNSAGHFSMVDTIGIRVPSQLPPGHGIVMDVDPASTKAKTDVDFHASVNKACISWRGFYHHTGVSFEVALGTAPNTSDVLNYQPTSSENATCLTSPLIKPGIKYFATVRAKCSGGSSFASSDGFLIIDQPNDYSQYFKMYDGRGCDSNLKSEILTLTSTNDNSTLSYTTVNRLHIGQQYMLNSDVDISTIRSKDIHIKKISKTSIEFVPYTYHPVFDVASGTSPNHSLTISMCTEDTEFKVSRNSLAFHWDFKGAWTSFLTHFEVEVEEKTDCQITAENCYITVDIKQVKTPYVDFTNVQLQKDKLYRGKVRPCFDTTCLDWIYSNGVRIVSDKISLRISNQWNNDAVGSTCETSSLNVDFVNCGEQTLNQENITFQWAPADKHKSLLADWKTEQGLVKGQTDVCLDSKLLHTPGLLLCVRATCQSGLTATVCDPVTPRQHVQSHGLLIEADLKVLPEIKAKITENSEKLHHFDIDYTESNTRVAGVLLTLVGRTSTWYITSTPQVPSLECRADPSCSAEVEAEGPIGAFPNVQLENNKRYYICVHSQLSHSSGGSVFPAVSQCGDGFIVDDDPPHAGIVEILNQKDGFLTDKDMMIVTWNKFSDHEALVPGVERSGIANFSYAVGTYPEGHDVKTFTSAGFVHNVHIVGINLQGGAVYYVTVKATDYLGHTSTSVSDAVTLDFTPPITGSISVGGALDSRKTVSSDELIVHWEGFEDEESGIDLFQISVASKDNTEIVPYKETSGSFARLKTKGKLLDGHQYVVKVQTTNRAGLSSMSKSPPFIYDSSPPVIGVVREGENRDQSEEDYQTFSENLTCHWSEFHDPHTGLAYFRVGLGTRADTDDIETLSHVGLRRDFTWTTSLPLGIKLYCLVEVCNRAGLCSVSTSDGITLDNSPPVPGIVAVGPDGHHHKYHGHASTLTARWFGFEDPQTGIHHFEWCVGSARGVCDVLNITNNLLSDSVIKTGLSLPIGKQLYITVYAQNPAGLVSSATSGSFIVDTSPPTVVTHPKFISPYTDQVASVQWENSVLKLMWKFKDSESPIERHFISLSTHHDGSAAVESIHLGAQDSTTVLFEAGSLMRSGDTYAAVVTACNTAGLCTSAPSSQILIDRTPPGLGGFKYPLTWDRQVAAPSSKTRLHLMWYGFSDPESGITSYSISISRNFDGDELSGGWKTVPHNKSNTDQILDIVLTDHVHNGEDITLAIIATNQAGLSSSVGRVTVKLESSDLQHTHGSLEIERHSCPVQYCEGQCSCAVVGKMCELTNAVKNCTKLVDPKLQNSVQILPGLNGDEVFTKSASCLTAHWQIKDPSIQSQIKRVEWTMGKSGQEIGFPIFDKKDGTIWHDNGDKSQITYCLPHGNSLEHGSSYVVYLRLWLSSNQYTIVQSHPVTVDHTAPSVGRAKSPLDSDVHCKEDREFFKVGEIIKTCWDNVFQDGQSEIRSYEFWFGTSPEGNDVLDVISLGNQTVYTIPTARLEPGVKYYASVRATNRAGLQTTLVSDGFVVDNVKPIPGVVFNTERHKNSKVQNSKNTLSTSWHGFEDFDSFVQRFDVAVVQHDQILDEKLFKYSGIDNQLVISNLTLEEGKSYRVAVRAVDAAGLKSDIVYSPPLMVDTSPPKAYVCKTFWPNVALKYESVSDTNNMAKIKTSYSLKKGSLYELELHGDGFMYESYVTFTIGQLSILGRFEKVKRSILAAHSFISSEEGTVSISVSVEGNVSDILRLYLRECKILEKANSDDAVRVRQFRPSVVAVCTSIMDPESDVRSVWIGAGTSKDGYQIRALSPTAVSNHEMIFVKEPHGSPVYVTVMAENHAGLRTIFTSSPVTIDHTPPMLTITKTEILYGSGSIVSLDISWQTSDGESSVETCYCGGGESTHAIKEWKDVGMVNQCVISNISALHNSLLYASVKCVNKVNMAATKTSQPLLVQLHAPNFQQKSMSFFVDNQISVGDLQPHIQTYKDHVELFWDDIGSQAARYELRLLDGGVAVTNWKSAGQRSYVMMDGLTLKDGHVYQAQVRAMDSRHQYGQPINTSVLVESRSPTTTGVKPTVHLAGNSLTVNWSGVFNTFNMDVTYVVSMGTRKGYTDIANQLMTNDLNVTTSADTKLTGLFVTVMAKLDTGKFSVFSDFTDIVGA